MNGARRPGEFHPEPLTDPDLSLSTHPARAFSDVLRTLGYREGSNLKLTHKWAAGKMDELPVLAAQLVADKVDVRTCPLGSGWLS
jgi:hypothetical protein